jgi:pilus assembly protein CpaC
MIAACTTQFWRSRHRSRRPAAFCAALVVYIIVVLVAAPEARQPQAFAPAPGSGSPVIREAIDGSEIDLLVGRSALLNVGATIARVSLTVPDVADALVTAPTQLLIHGKQPGTISLFVWDRAGTIKTFEVVVRRDLNALKEQLRQLFPAEEITVLGSGKDVVVSGTVASKYVVEKAAEVAAGYVEKKENVVNLLKQQEGVASNQVMLRVRFAEVSRSALQELGASFFANGYKNEWFGRTQPPGVPGPTFDEGKLIFSDFLNLFVFNAKEGLGAVVRALENKGLFQSLAEPNLIATNGKEASFLAGGEYPYPVVQPSGTGAASVTIMFKEFGVRLNFTPTVLGGDLINLKVKPEVSALDFANAIELEGFRIPALSTRRTETEIELRDGQTFAIAGLMNNTLTNSMSKIPGLGDIPILGYLFRSRAYQKNQTELVVMITPSIVRRGQMGVSEGLPSLVEPYLGPPAKTHPNPDAYVGSPRYPVNQGTRGGNNPAPAPAPSATVTPSAAVPSRPIPQHPSQMPAGAQPSKSALPTSSAPMTLPKAPAQSTPAPRQSMPAAPGQSMPMAPGQSMPMAPAQSTPSAPVLSMPPAAAQSTPRGSQPMPMATPMPAPAIPQNAPMAMPKGTTTAPAAALPMPGEPDTPPAPPAAAPLTKEQAKAIEKAREQERKAAEAEAKKADRVAKERAKREAEIARKKAELERKKADEDSKREKTLNEAAQRLKDAQDAYRAELEKSKGSSGVKSPSQAGAKGTSSSGSGR